ncbi:hypothetical protein AB0E04_40600 [Streptomyces sp. NPDC048251]|uniref:hypothetical protein n=1 Tax=unclassified Streptomyces TaxID=2593676 RepID=UPI00324CC848
MTEGRVEEAGGVAVVAVLEGFVALGGESFIAVGVDEFFHVGGDGDDLAGPEGEDPAGIACGGDDVLSR